ncbi:unnamed protein product, partial [Adineta steineri]
LLKVAIIGTPNAGKSTFVNRLMGWRISSVSKRPHTTRHRTTGVLTDANKQIVFLDTPGFVAPWRKKRHNLEKSMILDPHSCLWDANLICVVHDVSNHWLRFKLDEEILKCLYAHPDKEAILILNKVDSVKRKRMLLDVTTVLTDGSLNGIPYRLDSPYHRNGELDMERLFLKTAHEMNIPLPKSENDLKKEHLLADMKEYEKKLLNIQLENVNLDLEENQIKELISQHEEKGLTLENLSDDVPSHIPYKSIKDISPIEFKKDLMETTNWHLYYKKLSQIRLFTQDRSTWPYFNQVFMISAKQNRGIAAVRKYLFSRTKAAPWMFHRNFVTDQYPQEIAELCIREKMLEYLPEEIPYSYLMTNERWELDENDILNMTFLVYPRAKQLKRDVSVLLKNHAIIGTPNAGKSTFVNRLMGWRISSVSKRPHTTRHRTTGVLTDANKQIVFLDTPGFVAPWRKKRHNLEKSMILDPHSCLWDANLICVVHDVSNHWLRFKLDEEILKCLYAHPDKEAILILNKVDSVKRKRMLLDVTTVLTDGSLNGIPYRLDSPYHRNGELDMERLFLKTAHEMNIPLPKSENDLKKEHLLADMKEYEKKLLNIQLENVNLDLEENQIKELISQHEEKGLTLENLSDDVPSHIPYKSIKDISPIEFKKDLMETTNWHLYYKKLSQIRLFTQDRSTWPYFNQVFMISAKQNRGIAAVRKYLFSRTKAAPWMFHRNFVTDQYPQEIAELCIREKMLEYLPEEIPYSYLMTNERWELDENDILNMTFLVYPRAKQLKRDV